MIIAFTGMDGSGKSLQARALADSLTEEGVKSLYVWSRWSPFFLRPVIHLGRMLLGSGGNSEDQQYRSFRHSKQRMFRRRMLAQGWKVLACLDYSLQVLFKIKIRARHGRIIVCDRYVQDLLVDLGINFGYSAKEIDQLMKSRLLSLFPKPDLVFLLDLPADVAFQRKEDAPLSYLRDRRMLYLNFGRQQGVEVLDGTVSIQDLKESIYQKTLDFLNRGRLKGSLKRS